MTSTSPIRARKRLPAMIAAPVPRSASRDAPWLVATELVCPRPPPREPALDARFHSSRVGSSGSSHRCSPQVLQYAVFPALDPQRGHTRLTATDLTLFRTGLSRQVLGRPIRP